MTYKTKTGIIIFEKKNKLQIIVQVYGEFI